MPEGAATCPACGSAALLPAGSPTRRVVCGHCARCWEDGGRGRLVDVLACPGCPERGRCEACLTWLADSLTEQHVLADGAQVLVRPLVYGDRYELAAGFRELSLRTRQLRFFQAPDQLDEGDLEHLTNLDYEDHFALAAFLLGGTVPKGIGVARYLRDPADPALAEVAVTVMDAHQGRGIGTLLTRRLADLAVTRGIRAFVSYVQWGNEGAVDLLTAEGARISAAEPGIARIEMDLPVPASDAPDSMMHRVLRALGQLDGALDRRGHTPTG